MSDMAMQVAQHARAGLAESSQKLWNDDSMWCAPCDHAYRQQAELDQEKVKDLFNRSLSALDALLDTVPEDVAQTR